MRRRPLFALAPYGLQLAALVSVSSFARAIQDSAGSRAAKSAAEKPPVQKNRAADVQNIPIPGVGGAAPPRKKPAAQTPAPSSPTAPGTGPLLPLNPSRSPAPIVGPGQNPLLPGLSGLQARPVNPLIFGVNLPPSAASTLLAASTGTHAARLLDVIRAAAITNVRIAIRWPDVERRRGQYDWKAQDSLIRDLAGHGVAIVAVIEGVPPWAAAGPSISLDLEKFGFALASRYRGIISLWEFGSEPDLPAAIDASSTARGPGLAVAYAAQLRAFSRGIRRANPGAQVAVGGLATQSVDFLADLYRAGARDTFDAVALHPSAASNSPAPDMLNFAWIDSIRALIISKGDSPKPLWISDWGWPASATGSIGASVSDLHQARLIRQCLAGMRDRPFIVQASYRSLTDWRRVPTDPTSLEPAGLTNSSLQPKPAFAAFRDMATGINPEAVGRYARVSLVGALPLAEEAGVRGNAALVLVEADRPTGPLRRVWEGAAQGYEPGLASVAGEISAPIKALGIKTVRFDPFPNPDWVQPDRILVVDRSDSKPDERRFNIRWQYADSMIDSIDQAGAKAMLNFGTMPTALSSPFGNARAPRDVSAWTSCIREVVRRYNSGNRRQVAYWELSNEPNRGDFSLEEWLQLYEAFARSIVAVDPKARVGGPAVAGMDEAWLKGLVERCERDKVPLHFLSWHEYGDEPADAPARIESLRAWLKTRNRANEIELILSEWNLDPRPSPDNDSLGAAARTLSMIEGQMNGGPDRALYYSLREGPDPRNPDAMLSGRWGLLTRNNLPKPAYNAFSLLNRLDGVRVAASSEETSVHVIASRGPDRVSALIWLDPPERHSGKLGGSSVSQAAIPSYVRIRGLPWLAATAGEEWTLDSEHGDVSRRPDRAALESAGKFVAAAGDIELPVVMTPGSAALVVLRPAKTPGIDLAVESPRYVVYNASRIPLVVRVHNPAASPKLVSLTVGGRDFKGEPAAPTRVSLGPGESKTAELIASTDFGAAGGQRFFSVTTGTNETASTSVTLAPPITARLERPRIDLPPLTAERIKPQSRSATFKLIIDNRSESIASLGVAGGSTSVSVSVPPHQSAAVPVVIPVATGGPGIEVAPIRLIRGSSTIETLTATVGTLAPARYARNVPRINGDLSEWADADRLPLAPALRDRRGSISSISGQAMAMWDEHALYLALSIADGDEAVAATPARPDSAGGPAAVVISVGEPGQVSAAANRQTPLFTIDLARTGQRLYRVTGNRGPGAVVAGARVAAIQEGRRTVYELAIPWTELGHSAPGGGAALPIAIRINDSRGLGRPGLEFAGAQPGSDPMTLPALVLRNR